MKKWVNNVNVGLLMMRLLELEKLGCGDALFEGRAAQAAVGLVMVREKMQFEESRSIYRNLKGVYCSGQILLFP